LLAIPLLGAAGVAGVHRHVLRLWAKLEDLIIWFKSLMKDMKDKIDDAVHALLLKFSAPYEQSEWCVHLEVESPEVLQGLLDGSKTYLKLLELEWLSIKDEAFPTWYTNAQDFNKRVIMFELQCKDLNTRVTRSSARITASVYVIDDYKPETTACMPAELGGDAQHQLQSGKLSDRESKLISDMRNLWAGAVKQGQFYGSTARTFQQVD